MPQSNTILNIYITTGESAGVGPQITLQALASMVLPQKISHSQTQYHNCIFHIIGDVEQLSTLAQLLGLAALLTHPQIRTIHHPLCCAAELGRLNLRNGLHPIELLHIAVQKIYTINQQNHQNQQGQQTSAALVTAPIHKKIIAQALQNQNLVMNVDAGMRGTATKTAFYGHTEYLAQLACLYGFTDNIPQVLMLLKGRDALRQRELAVALASVHIPLLQVSEFLKNKCASGAMAHDWQLIAHAFTHFFAHDAQNTSKLIDIKVAGINPHAGEGGLLGTEETWLQQAIQSQSMPSTSTNTSASPVLNYVVQGPFSGDTLFLQNADCFYYMHHDQGLAPFKYATFGLAANITLGLPFIRTSVDHGTALDIAANIQHPNECAAPIADASSMLYAIEQAVLMLRNANHNDNK